jgi:hypothetical protein
MNSLLAMKRKTIFSIFTVAMIISFALGFSFNNFQSTSTDKLPMKKVTGIGGIFFKCKDTKKIKEWYSKNFGLNMNEL